MSKTLITLDGPSGVGKTTIGKRLASELNFEFFSSGLLYRVIALHNEKTNSFNLNEFEIVSNDPVVCNCLLYTSPSPRDDELSRMPSSA